jgi:hypothetical protein
MANFGSLDWINADETLDFGNELNADDIGFKNLGDEDSKGEIFKSIMLSTARIRNTEIKSVAISMKALYVLTTD